MKKSNLNVSGNNSTSALVIDESVKRVSNRVNSKADVSKDTANVLEETESIKKSETFAKVRKLFGFSEFDAETTALNLAQDLASGKISYKDFVSKMSATRKATEKENEQIENRTFEEICETLQNSDLIQDLSLFVGTSNLLSLKEKIFTPDNKLVMFHGKQSENDEKFDTYKVTLKGMHKPYTDLCFTSLADYSTSNVIRAFRNYCYFLKSLNRCKKQREKETISVNALRELVTSLKKDFGFSREEIIKLVNETFDTL